MRKDAVIFSYTALICVLLGAAQLIIATLELSYNQNVDYFFGVSLLILGLVLLAVSYTKPLNTSKYIPTPEEIQLISEFKKNNRLNVLKLYLKSLGTLSILGLGTYLSFILGFTSLEGILILLFTIALYLLTNLYILPKLHVYKCPSCNKTALECTVLLSQYGSKIYFKCNECAFELDWHSGIVSNPNKRLWRQPQ